LQAPPGNCRRFRPLFGASAEVTAGCNPITMSAAPAPAPPPAPRNATVRWFGRWQLLRLLGKSERSMAWRVADPRSGQELMIVLPRVQPADAAALEHWQQAVRQASRLQHPQLAAVVDIGVQDGWPYVAYDPRSDATLAERLPAGGLPGNEAAALVMQALQGLAFAHEAGLAHHDVQPFLMLVSDGGQLRVAGLAVAPPPPVEAGGRQGQQAASERDLLATGVLLHGVLAGAPALDEPDVGRVVDRLPPLGRDIVRLPWQTRHRIAEPLRAIVNRATERQERQRYRNARTLLRALEGWLQAESAAGAGPLALLSDRLRTAGVLPSSPGAAARVARLALMEGQRTFELAEVVLEDFALSFEMLRLANTAQARSAGSGPVLTVRRAIAMLGLEGLRRAALALREWPGPLDDAGAARLDGLVERIRRAARTALALRPAGYDGEVVYLLTLLQNLGRLVVHYHFADEAQQIARLMQSAPAPREGEPEEPGMSEEAAAFAVLGADIDAIGLAVARHWGLDEALIKMMQRLPLATPVRTPDGDDDLLRLAASCANEAADALALPAPKVAAALQRVVQRYGRVLEFGPRELQDALRGEARLTEPMALTQPAPLDEPGAPAAAAPRRVSSLRAGLAR
jgi:non-specific serine/threonine protein kinase